MNQDIDAIFEDCELELTVDGIDYTVTDEGDNTFTIMNGEENFAEIGLTECGECYTYDYSPAFSNFDDCSGVSYTWNHDGLVDFFIWVIATNE